MTFLDAVCFDHEGERINGMIVRIRPKWPREKQEYVVLTKEGKEYIVQEKDLTLGGWKYGDPVVARPGPRGGSRIA